MHLSLACFWTSIQKSSSNSNCQKKNISITTLYVLIAYMVALCDVNFPAGVQRGAWRPLVKVADPTLALSVYLRANVPAKVYSVHNYVLLQFDCIYNAEWQHGGWGNDWKPVESTGVMNIMRFSWDHVCIFPGHTGVCSGLLPLLSQESLGSIPSTGKLDSSSFSWPGRLQWLENLGKDQYTLRTEHDKLVNIPFTG